MIIDLSQLPAPTVIEPLDYEQILSSLKADLGARYPAVAELLTLESEPLVKLLEVAAYREVLLRARVNDAARACLLAYAGGADLDHLAALLGVGRLVVAAGDPSALPPVPPTLEDDVRLRLRAQMALEGEAVAGSVGSYIFHALSASARVADVAVDSPTPGIVRVAVLATDAGGVPDAGLLDAVAGYLSAAERRPLTDDVQVEAATLAPYAIEAVLYCYPGPSPTPVLEAAQAAVARYVADHHRLGHDITRSGLYAALHQPGVQRVDLVAPAIDLAIGPRQAGRCTAMDITYGGNDV